MHVAMPESRCTLPATGSNSAVKAVVQALHQSRASLTFRVSHSRNVHQHRRNLNRRDAVVRAAIAAPPPPGKEKTPEDPPPAKLRREEAILFQGICLHHLWVTLSYCARMRQACKITREIFRLLVHMTVRGSLDKSTWLQGLVGAVVKWADGGTL